MIRLPSVSESYPQAPPPSPIPTGKGSRSAANSVFTHYLHRSLHVPHLSLPPTTTTPVAHTAVERCPHDPRDVSFPAIRSRDADAVDRLLGAAREFGVFRVTDHGISGDDLTSLANAAERAFRALEEDTDVVRCRTARNFDTKQIEWVRSGDDPQTDWARGWAARDGSRHFRKAMQKISRKLDEIGKEVCEVFSENWTRRQFGSRFEEKDSVVRLYQYNRRNNNNSKASSSNKVLEEELGEQQHHEEEGGHALCLHLPATRSRFLLHYSSQSLISFRSGPEGVVVAVGRRLEEWSMGDFKCISGQVMCSPRRLEVGQGQPCFSLELKCLSLNFDVSNGYKDNGLAVISIKHQILVGIALAMLCKLVVAYLW